MTRLTSVMRHALFVAPFGELAEARVLADFAHQAEARGWDGLFLWDHIQCSRVSPSPIHGSA